MQFDNLSQCPNWTGARFRLLLPLLITLILPSANADSLRVLSQNMNRLFDDVNNGQREQVLPPARFRQRIKTTAKKFGKHYGLPHIIALQEVENLNVLHRIAAEIEMRYAARYRRILIPGQDVSGINLAYLVRYGLEIRKVDQLFTDLTLAPGKLPLFSRPPLYLEVCYLDRCLALLNLHLRSMRGLDDHSQRERVQRKRRLQADAIAVWVNRFQHSRKDISLLLLGDFNALTPATDQVDVVGIIRGQADHGVDLVEPDLIDLTRLIPAPKRYSFIFRRQKQQLDYMLINRAFTADLININFSRIDYHFTDHAGLLAVFEW